MVRIKSLNVFPRVSQAREGVDGRYQGRAKAKLVIFVVASKEDSRAGTVICIKKVSNTLEVTMTVRQYLR